MHLHRTFLVTALMVTAAWWFAPRSCLAAGVKIHTLCRVRGQEDIVLQGLGLVTGLKGTGDGASALPTIRALATAMELLGNPVASNLAVELRDAKNVALVMVTARVPSSGARRGDRIDCFVSAISAKSLSGGRLFLTPLTGPIPQPNPPVFAFAEGPVTLDSTDFPTTGRVFEGCRFIEDFLPPFASDGRITLVLHSNYASFQVAQDIADAINTQLAVQNGGRPLAKALDQVNIEVLIPPAYADDVVNFVAQVLSVEILEPDAGPMVVIRERSGTVVIGGDVEIGPVIVTHKNLVVEAGPQAFHPGFTPIDPRQPGNPKLKNLVEALNAVRVPAADIVEIVKAIDRQGKLFGRLVVE